VHENRAILPYNKLSEGHGQSAGFTLETWLSCLPFETTLNPDLFPLQPMKGQANPNS